MKRALLAVTTVAISLIGATSPLFAASKNSLPLYYSADASCFKHGAIAGAQEGYVRTSQTATVDFSQYPVTHNPVSVRGQVRLVDAQSSTTFTVYVANDDTCSAFATIGTMQTNREGKATMPFGSIAIPDNVFNWYFIIISNADNSRLISVPEG